MLGLEGHSLLQFACVNLEHNIEERGSGVEVKEGGEGGRFSVYFNILNFNLKK